MALYTFVFCRGSSTSEQTGSYPDDVTAISVARDFLVRVAGQSPDHRLSISVGRRTTRAVNRLGVWDFDAAARWAPAE